MWCRHCQLDVPGIASSQNDQQICCARCNQVITLETKPHEDSRPDMEEWDLKADIRELERMVGPLDLPGSTPTVPTGPAAKTARAGASPTPATQPTADSSTYRRVDAGARQRSSRKSSRRKHRRRRAPWSAWAFVSLGLMVFAFGAGLVVWSIVTGRSELWNLGLPITMAGQGAALLGLVLQLDCLWQSNRELARGLDEADEQLMQLEHTSHLLAKQSGSSQSFYEHFSAGASPHLLLADLKGQLDVLSTKLERD